ncbi:acetyl esterase [Psychrosphaera sp. B3R10]|uniref:sialate O-acetylesterase n=1 Tax=unclassified Psychrosphaera TaxID=2641570 RepID=UPI001C0A0380|nr:MULTISPECIES: sialate O-acetylesterase [unclassified Psychrosphaera]MBU2883963.1 acetyl esterase [Psychrosphaera sp. I2R16]MBU2990368.1 acetyl esterase [Psychrosphaera sp. B3R10]
MFNLISRALGCCAFLLFFSASAIANISLPRLIGDGVVLQRDSNNLLWGWADNHEQVSVSLDGKLIGTVTALNQKWSINLPPQIAGSDHKIVISGHNTLTIRDVSFGDVWLASGQSNMELTMARVKVKYPEEFTLSQYPNIRLFKVPRKYDFEQAQDDVTSGSWQRVDSSNLGQFPAVSYFFGTRLAENHQIPIGIINSSYGGSPAEAWLSESALEQFPHYLDIINKYRQENYLANLIASDHKRNDDWYNQLNAQDLGLKPNDKNLTWSDRDYDASMWQTTVLPSFWQDKGIDTKNGVVWFRKEFELSKAETNLPAKLILGRIVDADTAFINGRKVGNTTYQYPPRRYSVDKNILKAGKNVVVVRVISSAGKGGFVSDKPYQLNVGSRTIDLNGPWRYRVGAESLPLAGPSFQEYKQPLGFFNAMLSPILKTKIKGAIWYQGESNTDRPTEYTTLFPAMIRDWRKQFQQGNFPFIFVQLANFMAENNKPVESQWAETREAQRLALAEPNTAMAVTIDIGEWNDIHPLNKKDVGERLFLAAQKLAYGNNEVVYSGPEISKGKVVDNHVWLSFKLFGSKLAIRNKANENAPLLGFSLAGNDGKFVWANATIVGDKIKVWSNQISNPVTVRYGWADNPVKANLINVHGLPASPFQLSI